jgi:peptidoglycan L-alanyl-D-glutamate endopeptidase CwlK
MAKLLECDLRLQSIFNEAVKTMDMTIVTGYRGEAEQNQAFADGRSKLKFPHGKHNKMPSMAVDACPYPYDWDKNVPDIKILADHIKATAEKLQIDITYGGDWADFPDTDHFELKEIANG